MAEPIRNGGSSVTLAHLDAAIKAGLAPVERDLDNLRRDLGDATELLGTIADDIYALSEWFRRRRRIRRWIAANAGTAAVQASAGVVIAVATAILTYLLT